MKMCRKVGVENIEEKEHRKEWGHNRKIDLSFYHYNKRYETANGNWYERNIIKGR